MKTAEVKVKTMLQGDEPYIGEYLHETVIRVMQTGEAIIDGAPKIYTEKSEGVRPEHDIRTDKWDIALDASEKINTAKIEKSIDRFRPASDAVEGSPSEN